MKNNKITFGKVFWPSLVAALIVSIIGIIIWVIAITGVIAGFSLSKTDKQFSLDDKTVLHMELSDDIGEKGDVSISQFDFKINYKLGVQEILHGLKKAKTDKKIKGVFIELGVVPSGMAVAKEIRDAIIDFKKSGKFVVTYLQGEAITQKAYYIASAADEVYGFPESNMIFTGLGVELSFFKNTLDKLDIEAIIVRGKNNHFKSAVEPYFREKMSDSSRFQIETYLKGLWYDFRKDIASSRNVSIERLNEIAENFEIQNVQDAVRLGLIDKGMYRDEVLDILEDKIKDDEVNLYSFSKYARKKFKQTQVLNKISDPNIAIIIAEGAISKVDKDGISSDKLCKLFKKARENKSVKAVIFRINSPGGSALASEEIWREVKLTNNEKPVYVSMGNVAASGGYYISAPATRIFAQPNTITGSIGVFGMIPYTGKMMNHLFGVTFDRVQTNKHAVLSTNRKLTEEELAVIQKNVDDIYLKFKNRVSEGRGMSLEEVERVARGRVWTGRDALKVGLVDELGGMKSVLEYVKKQHGIKKEKLIYYPKRKEDKFMDILEAIDEENEETDVRIETYSLPNSLVKTYKEVKTIEQMRGVQMRLPFRLVIE